MHSFKTSTDESPASEFVEQFRQLGKDVAKRVLLATWDKLPIAEQAAITADWSFWGRSKQQHPEGDWITSGFLTGRGFGKTISNAHYVQKEVEEGRAPLVCLIAQDEQSAIDIQVLGPSGLIAVAPPWCRPVWRPGDFQLVWPNGARAYVRTPEAPGKIRGLEYHLSWMIELQSWPKTTMVEAMSNVFLSTRLGYSRIVWDASPKRRHPLLKELLANHEASPKKHRVVRGTTHENATNLGENYVAEMVRKYGGTQKGKEELLGEMLEDADGALFKQSWIDECRKPAPEATLRKVVSIDPAVTNRKGSDTTGIVTVALGIDDRAYVLKDESGKHDVGRWAEIVLDRYSRSACDMIIAETNKGGSLVVQNIRAIAKERRLEVIVVGKDEKPQWMPGRVYVKEVHARGAKEDRAEPVATAYERKRVSHVIGADLASLEDTLTTWEPSPSADSPGDLDALVHACVELLELSKDTPDPKKGFAGIEKAGEALQQVSTPKAITDLAILLGGNNSDKI